MYIARILLVKGHQEEFEKVMHRIYAYATDEQIKLKIKVMQVAVQESIDITKSTTFVQRMQSILFVPRNRRALGMYNLLIYINVNKPL